MAVYQVLPNGNAPSGLRVGDSVSTAGGLYNIVAPGTPGATYNDSSGYWSVKSGLDNAQQIAQYTDMLQKQANANTAKSQDFAREQMSYQTESNAKAMSFSADEAEKNRQWQEYMSNTAHQREVNDLIRAGLNPVLSANAGASVGSGAQASGVSSSGAQGQVDLSVNTVLGALVSALISQSSALQTTSMTTQASKAIAEMQTQAGLLNALTSAKAVEYSANMSYATQKYALAKQEDFYKDYPQGLFGLVSSLISGASSGAGISGVFENLVDLAHSNAYNDYMQQSGEAAARAERRVTRQQNKENLRKAAAAYR